MCSRCVRTVARERVSTCAASLFDNPLAMSRRISISRSVSGRVGGSSRVPGGGRRFVGGGGRAFFGNMEVPEQPPREAGLDDAAARLHLADGFDHLLRRRAFQEIPARARLE